MIQINLLQQSGGKHRAAGPKPAIPQHQGSLAIVWVAVLLMLLINGGAGYFAFTKVAQAGAEYLSVRSKYDSIRQDISTRLSKADEVRKFREVVTNQMDVLRSLEPEDRILWCEKINMLANLTPPSVFLSEVEVKEYVEMVETDQSIQAHERWKKAMENKKENEPMPKEPPVVKRPVIHYVMRITGLAMGDTKDKQLDNAMKFHKAMISHEKKDAKGEVHHFMDGFTSNIGFENVVATEYEGTPVNQFTFKLTTKPLGAEQPKPAAPSRAQQVAAADR